MFQMHASGSSLSTWVIFVCTFLVGPLHCTASLKKSACTVKEGRADCSHLSLHAVPPDLPENITSLDMSHNQLVRILPDSFSRYTGLLHLNISYNSITKLGGDLCQNLHLLLTLNMEHNEVHMLTKEDLNHCTSLTWLNMASNRLRLQGEPFIALQRLAFLDVSMNNLQSAMLGCQPQLPDLVILNLGHNDFTSLKTKDFFYLNHSSLQVLNLSAVSLKTLEPGCFKPISSLRMLILDRSSINLAFISKLCLELTGTSIEALSLKKLKLPTLTNKTFTGLQNTNLTFLDLAGNGINKIDDGSFQWLTKLQTLVLTDNNIKRLTRGTFQGLKMLTKLQMMKALVNSHKSPLPVIDNFAFQPLSNLKRLILQKTAFMEIKEKTFTGLTSLTELDLSWSSYIHTPQKHINSNMFVSLADSPLQKLDLTGNALTQIDPGSFSILKNLSILLLDRNFIKQTLTGDEFKGLDEIQELHMTNNIQSINLTSDSFVNIPTLKVLTLGKSLKAEALNQDPSPFHPLANLTVLDLSNNNIANLRENMLEGLLNLKVLKLQHNNLARLWKTANLGGPVLFLKHTQRLINLWLDYNGLDEIPVKAFRGLSNLRELSLSNNLLDNLQYSVFDDLNSTRVLRLEKNLITSVRPEVFSVPLRNLSVLVMAKNPFDCTCESILWFVTWLNNTNVTSVPGLRDQYICNTPLAYFKHPIVDFDPLSCKDMTPFEALFILSTTAVLMLIIGALLARFHSWRIQFYWNILINRTLGFSDAKVEEVRDFDYDAYIIHAEEDATWVEKRMVPLEKDKCRFCLEDRDSILGFTQLESIVDNIRKSRKILFVVTESLLTDPWCARFTVHQALHQVIEASRDSVVLVFLQDVHDYKLSHTLFLRRGMLRSRCILYWPPQKERVPAFYQKLFIALGMTNRVQE
ncbi:toll-like receptor 3 [Nothobranchius furzeri]|uniref:Toll-like receptor 3 n=3 Tax=Nothobranchius TaxID=28779 RepID=A0A1A8B3X6_NOTFU|nr:toll-like receptor 3 [Nothobranchius furzeri]KAF7225406.1 toll-like receptor 3 [Nothobranchius furzeri]